MQNDNENAFKLHSFAKFDLFEQLPKTDRQKNPVNLKTLVALVVLQTAILIALFVRVNDLDVETTQIPRAEPEAIYVQPLSAQQPGAITVRGYTDEDRLREIIREEFAIALEDVRTVAGNTNASPAQPLQSGPDYERSRKDVAQSVDYYVSVGRITEREMSRLQQDIAKLNPADRRAMMGAIVRAMNNGRLEGQL